MIRKPVGLWICIALCIFAGVRSDAETFNRFGASTGVLKGNAATYVTTPAISSDIVGLWGGTCNASSYLRGDGTCASPAGAGTVTSVGLTVPTGLSVTGSPVTSSGTLGITTSLNGLVLGNGSGFTTAANSNVISLWTGTCSSSTFLRGDGSCATPSGSGTVTSVGLTVPTGLSVTGSPVTGAGSLGITTALNGVLRGTGSGFATSASSDIIGLWTGTCSASTFLRGDGSCAAAGGGSGTVTSVGLSMPAGFSVSGSPVTSSGSLSVTTALSGLVSGTGSGFANATAADVTGEFSGTCNSSTFLRGDGSCQSIASPPAGANPTATIGATAVNGVASTFMRSDAAPALPATLPAISGVNLTALNANNISSGVLGVARGGTGTTTSTGTGNVVLSASPTLTGTTTAATVAATTVTVGGVNVCRQDGTNCPGAAGLAYGVIAVSGSTCSVSGIYDSSGIASCVYNAAGSYLVNMSVGSGNGPTCTVTAFGSPVRIMTVSGNDLDTVAVNGYNTSATATDGSFAIHCMSI